MVSDQFRRDYKAMTAQGVTFTPEDIIRLNALSVRVRLSQNAANTVHLPRLAFLGDLVLREPSIAHELWVESASRWIDCRDDRNFLFLHGYALSHGVEELPDADADKLVIRTVYKFAGKRLAKFTTAQLSAAVTYALVGNDWTACERGGRMPKPEANALMSGDERPSPTVGLLVRAKALRLPITTDEAFKMTSSELDEIIRRTAVADGTVDLAAEKTRAFGDYVRAREEIRNRSKA